LSRETSLLDSVRGTVEGVGWPPVLEGPAATLLALTRQLESSQWLDPEALRARQFAQLARLAPWLAAHSTAFAARLRGAGLSAEALGSPDALGALPPIGRRWLQSEKGIACSAVPPAHSPLGATQTSGSTGEPLRIHRTRVSQLIWLAMALRSHVWHRSDFAAPLATVRATNAAIVQHKTWGPPAGLLFETGPALTLPINLSGDEMLARLRDYCVGNLIIYPNALSALLDAVADRGEGLPELRRLRTIGEIVTPELRGRARDLLGVEIFDAYSSQEVGYVAMQCPERGLYHVMAEALIVEVLRPDGTPCKEGETGAVTITDLHNHATPLIRYEIGDQAEIGPACPCGRGLPTLRRIIGRDRNLILMPDGSRRWPLIGALGERGFAQFVPVLQVQLIQRERERIEVRLVVARPLSAGEERRVADHIRHSLGHPFHLDFHYFDDRLPTPPSGKFEDFIRLIDAAQSTHCGGTEIGRNFRDAASVRAARAAP
jgi:phenylacetate-CoA ligase